MDQTQVRYPMRDVRTSTIGRFEAFSENQRRPEFIWQIFTVQNTQAAGRSVPLWTGKSVAPAAFSSAPSLWFADCDESTTMLSLSVPALAARPRTG